MSKKLLTLSIWCLITHSGLFAQQILSVTSAAQPPYNDMVKLIRDQLTGSGVEILSVEANNDFNAIGYFTDGDSSIGIKRGLVLTTGSAENATKSGLEFANEHNIGGQIQPELALIASSASLNNVAYFRIVFRPFSDSIQFKYVFASEEYPEFSCTVYNDLFGFFLSGPNPNGGSYNDQNIALIPYTNLPVSINNIHPSNPVVQNCPPFFVQYLNDNNNSDNQPVYDGFTNVFTAEAKVVPCATYEMVLAIADIGDSSYDSGVFLEAKSWDSELGITSTLIAGNDLIPENATADTISFVFKNIPEEMLPLQIRIEGNASNGIDFSAVDSITTVNSLDTIIQYTIQPIADTLHEQIETVQFNIYTGGTDCLVKSFALYIADPDSLYSPLDSIVLPPSGTSFLTVVPTSLSNKTWTFSNNTPIPIAQESMNKSNITVNIPFDILDDISMLQSVCFNINHGWDEDLDIYLIAPNGTFVELSTDNGGNGDNFTNTCFSPAASSDIRGGMPFAPANAAPFTGTFQPEGLWSDILGTPITGTWSLGVVDDTNGFLGTLNDWSLSFTTADLGNFKYLWSTGDTTPTLQVSTSGTYEVTVRNQIGTFTKKFVVAEGSVGLHAPLTSESAFRLSPNPSKGETVITLNEKLNIQALKVYDLNGSLVLEQASVGTIQGSGNLPKGVYIVSLECAEGIFVQKLLRW